MSDTPYFSGLGPAEHASDSTPLIPGAGYVEPGVRVDVYGRIDEDATCRVCSYNLRGGDPNGTCPECGTAVGWSLVGDLLRYADPDWVQKLASGMTWLLVSIVVGFVMGIMAGVMVAVLGPSGGGQLVMLGVQVIAALISAVGYWLFTEPEPVEKIGEPVRVRLWARWGCLLSVILGYTGGVVALADATTSAVITIVGQCAGIAGFFALFIYARRLALRVPDEGLAKQTRIVMWGFVVILTIGIAMALLMLLTASTMTTAPGGSAPSGPNVGAMGGLLAVGCVVGVGYLVFGIWTLVLLVLYRSRFTREAEEARRTWAARRT